MKKILCADIGTSSLKSAVIDEEGRVLASARVGFTKCGDDFASREWITALKSALDEIFKAGSSENDQESSIIIDSLSVDFSASFASVEMTDSSTFSNSSIDSSDSSAFASSAKS